MYRMMWWLNGCRPVCTYVHSLPVIMLPYTLCPDVLFMSWRFSGKRSV